MKLHKLLSVCEQNDLVDDVADDNNGSYEREKKVSLLILRTFRKCGLQVVEHSDKHSGTRDNGDYWGYDVLYTEDDREANVTLDEAELSDLVKLKDSGLIDGNCTIAAASNGTLRVTFQVHKAIATGNAEISNESLCESVPTDDSWYVLNVRKREILASELTRAEAEKMAKQLHGTVWFTRDGAFYNATEDVHYSSRGWLDKS